MQRTATDPAARADAARNVADLFGHARLCLGMARRAGREGRGDPEPILAKMRSRLVDAVWKDCLLFDEHTIYALARFVAAWRAAAYVDLDSDRAREADAALEESYRIALSKLQAAPGPQDDDPSRDRLG